MRYAAIAILMLCSTAGAQQTAPGDSMEAEGLSTSVQAITLDELSQFPDSHQGVWTLTGVEIYSCDRMAHSGMEPYYSISLYEPSTSTIVYSWASESNFGTRIESSSLGDQAAHLYKQLEKSPMRVRLMVRDSVNHMKPEFDAVILSIEWLDKAGNVIASAR